MDQIIKYSNELIILFTGVISLFGGMGIQKKRIPKEIEAPIKKCPDCAILETRCDLSSKALENQLTLSISNIKTTLELEHKENRADHHQLFEQLRKIASCVTKNGDKDQ